MAKNIDLTAEQENALVQEILDLHHEYDYESTTYGVETVLNKWWENKGKPMTELFGDHPNYVPGKFMIILDADFERKFDITKISNFEDWIELKIEEDRELIRKISDIFDEIRIEGYPIITKRLKTTFNRCFPELRATENQKISRLIGKLCKKLEVDKDPNYNAEYAKFCDAINPTKIKRKVFISWNPIDYYTMSFGHSWASCHTIDKTNKRNSKGTHYQGCYSGGTQSYMLDTCSVIFYTLTKDGEKSETPELEDKVTRCMFHINPEKGYFVQGRMYPQDNDGVNSSYKTPREIMQRILSEAWDVPNLWINRKGTDECRKVIIHDGANYPDYFNFNSCNVSYPKGTEDEYKEMTYVGHTGICPVCGCTHEEEETITCESCYRDSIYVICNDCGDEILREDAVELDGEFYCQECVRPCEDCGELHRTSDMAYVQNYGYVDFDCLYHSGNFAYCESCGEWLLLEEGICTEDGNIYCCPSCAVREGYVETNRGEWHPVEDTIYCEKCGQYVCIEDFNGEEGRCNECAELGIDSDESFFPNFGNEVINLSELNA